MRKLMNIRVGLLGCVIFSLCSIAALVDANGPRRRGQPGQPACCVVVQTIYIEKESTGGGGGTGSGRGNRSDRGDPNSHKIYGIIILDDNASDIKEAVEKEGNQIRSLFSTMHVGETGYFQYLTGAQATKDVILAAIRDIPVGPKDVLFVYYNGHGEKGPESHTFKLTHGDPLPRSEVKKAMEDTKCLLKVLITDTCFKDATTPKEDDETELTSSSNKNKVKFKARQQIEQQVNTLLLPKLFLEYKGTVDINSCKPDEYAFSGIFTPTLVDVSRSWPERKQVTWNAYFKKVQEETKSKAEKAAKEDTANPAFKDNKDTQTVHSFTDLTQSVTPWDPSTELKKRDETAEQNPEQKAQENTQTSAAEPANTPARATLRVELPAQAKLFIDETPTQQQNQTVRTFQTPHLPAGETYHYILRAELMVDGSLAQVTRKVSVKAGNLSSVNLSNPELFKTAAVDPIAPVAAVTPTPAFAQTGDKKAVPTGDR